MEQYMLTTVDNPYDPFTQFDEWFLWDTSKGYNSLSYLGRIVRSSDELSEADQSLAIQDAINEIVSVNAGLYKRVVSTISNESAA